MIEVRDVAFAYGRRSALKGISLSVRPGEFLGVLGPNGSGKSTLLRLMAGLLQPASGRVTLEGTDLSRIPRRELAGRLAFVPQRVDFVFPFTAGELVMMGRYARMQGPGLDESPHREAVRQAMQRTGVEDLAGRRVTELSGGEAQRVRVAQALAQEAELLLLDEPNSHLDVNHQLELMELLCGLGRTVVASLHDLNLASLYCDRLVLLQAGSLAVHGPPAEVLTEDTLERTFGARLRVTSGARPTVSYPRREPDLS
ncbi:MAG: ABC transporter ATP-binding protein [Candidatus Eremiobacterota bacterium]